MDKVKALVDRWRKEAGDSDRGWNAQMRECADELSQALADSAGVDYERIYETGYRAGLGAAAAECRRLSMAKDYGDNDYVRDQEMARAAVLISGLPVPCIESAGGDVDDDMVGRAIDAWDNVYDGVSHNREAAMTAALQAALRPGG